MNELENENYKQQLLQVEEVFEEVLNKEIASSELRDYYRNKAYKS